jgi:hypothetical protein
MCEFTFRVLGAAENFFSTSGSYGANVLGSQKHNSSCSEDVDEMMRSENFMSYSSRILVYDFSMI